MTVRDGVLVQTSVSEIETFDPEQEGGCPRRWWFDRAMDLKPDQNKAQTEGEAGHAHLAHYLRTGERPKGRPLMGKAVNGVIAKGALPTPGPDLFVELRFSGQDKYDAAGNWIPLDVAETLHLAGVPLEGFIDLVFRRGDVPEVWDHKFFTPARPELSPDPYAWLKKPSDLINTVQMPVYALSQMPFWPDAQRWRLVHHCVSKKGVDSQIRSAIVTVDQVLERKAAIELTINQMRAHASAQKQDEVPFNRRSCSAWQGCPHQSICSAFKQGAPAPMALTPEEEALFAGIDDAPIAPPPAPAVEAAPPAAPKERRMKIEDVAEEPKTEAAPPPAPAAPAVEVAPFPCKCGAVLTPENGSKLRDGTWKHIGCPADKAAEPPPEPKKRRSKPAPLSPEEIAAAKAATEAPKAPELADAGKVATLPPPGPKLDEVLQEIREVAERREEVAAPAVTAPVQVPEVKAAAPAPAKKLLADDEMRGLTIAALHASVKREGTREVLASLLENLATLVRSAA